uniref:Uncharacterized protein n=1 Tax=Panagrolaimus sp. PS1159 TaxID=55785 RepID=A0AC35FDF4_9BILA
MQHVTVLLTIIILLVTGFFTLTAVILLMTEDPTQPNENSRDELMKEHRKQYYKLENSEEDLSKKYYSLRPSLTNVRTRLSTVETIASSTATTAAELITIPTTQEYQTEAITATAISSKRPFRVSPITIKVNHSIFHGLERMETEKPELQEVNVEIAQLHLIREIRSPTNEKISTLMIKNSYLYLPLTTGEILVYNLSNYDLVTTFKTTLSFYRIGFLGQNIVATEIRKNTLSILDEQGRVAKQLKMLYDSKDMQINEDQDGKIIKKLAAPGGSYSLGIGLYESTLFAAKRGEQEIHAFNQETGEYKTKLANGGHGSAIWSALAFDANKMYALEYMQNIVKVFLLP